MTTESCENSAATVIFIIKQTSVKEG